jgi:4'-phosphopantetheinyl transferase
MPLIRKISLPLDGVLGVWHNTEGDEFFLSKMKLFPSEIEELSSLKARKKSEWLCSRYLLHLLSGRHDRGACLKDEYGKPYLDGSDYQISISHSDEYTAIIAGPYNVGLDIQIYVDKIKRIQSKFVSDLELNLINKHYEIESLLTIWGAKESMYKAYGKKSLDFKKHMTVSSFAYDHEGFNFEGSVDIGSFYQKYDLFCQKFHNLTIVYAIAQQ